MAQKLKVNDQLFIIDGNPMGGDEVTLEGITFDRPNRRLSVGSTNITGYLAVRGITNPATEDCSDAIEAAIADLTAAGGGELFFPRGVYRVTRRILIGRRFVDEDEYRYYGYLIYSDHGPSWNQAERDLSHTNTQIHIRGHESIIWGDFTGSTVTAILYYGLQSTNGAVAHISGMRFLGRDACVNGVPVFWGDIVDPTASKQMGLFIPGNTFTVVENCFFVGLDTGLLQVDNYWSRTVSCFCFKVDTGFAGHRMNAARFEQCSVASATGAGYRITGQQTKLSGCHTEQADPDVWIPTGLEMSLTDCYWETEAATTNAALVLGDGGNLSQHVTGLRVRNIFSHSHNYFADVRATTGAVIEASEIGRDDGQYSFVFRDALSHIELVDPVHDIQQFVARHDIVDPSGFDGLHVVRTNELDDPSVTVIKFDRPGPAFANQLGGLLHFERNSGANFYVDGELHVADVNQARIDDDGLLIEPAAENLLDDTLNLAAASWTTSHFPLTANQPDPEGNVTASVYRGAVEGGPFDHVLYQAGTLDPEGTTFSWYVGYLPGNIVRYVRIGDNSSAHFGYFDLLNGTIKSVTGTGARAEIERIGAITTSDGTFTIFRCSVTCTPTSGLLTTIYPSTTGTGTSFTDNGTGRLWLWHPQTEVSPYATTWIYPTNNPRGAETALIPIPNLGGEWCIEVVAAPCGPQHGSSAGGAVMGWNRSFPMGPVTATGTTPPNVTLSGLPTPATLSIWIDVSTGGLSDGTAQWRFSTDEGGGYSAPAAVPAGGGTAAIGSTGVTATFPNGTYNADNLYTSEQQHMVLFSLGVHEGGNSIEGYVTNGNAVCSVFDAAAAEVKCTSTALAVGNYYMGQRRLAFASVGQDRPAVYLDGRQTVPTLAGAGTGIFLGSAPAILRIGSTNDGMFGGVKIREIRIHQKSQVPPTEPIGAYSYQWSMDRGYVERAKCIAFLGDSNQQGVYDFTITPYPFGSTAQDEQAHIYALGSNTARQALVRWRLDVRGRGYKKMVLQIGINDVNALFPSAQVIADITQIVDEAVRDGVHVVIGTLFPAGHGASDYRTTQLNAINTAIRALGNNSLFVGRVALAEFYDALEDPGNAGHMNPAYDIDGGELHLNQAGQDVCAGIVAAALATI